MAILKKKYSHLVEDIRLGILLGLSISFGTQCLTWFGLGLTNWFVFLTYILLISFIVYAQRKHWLESETSISIIQALITIIIIVIISRYVFQLYMYIYITFADPNWVNTVVEYWTKTLRESNTSQEKINTLIEDFKNSYQPLQMFTRQIVKFGFGQIIIGIIASLYFVIKNK